MSIPKSLLVVRLGAMGDVIHTLHAACALRDAFPQLRIGWVIEERWAELLCARDAHSSGARSPLRPVVDFVHAVNTKAWRRSLFTPETRRQISAVLHEIREQEYEVAADFQGAVKSAVIASLAGAEKIIGTQQPREWPARLLYHERVPVAAAHVIDQYLELARKVTGDGALATRTANIQLAKDEHAETKIAAMLKQFNGKFVIMNPGAGWGAKEWPAERYGEAARALAGLGYVSLINYGPGEDELVANVQREGEGAAVPVSCSIAELIALTRQARLFIGGDTGPLHLAAALSIPVVAIYGPTDPARNGPYGTRSIVLRNAASRTSLSHTRALDPGLLRISAEEVITAAKTLLEAPHA